MKNNTLKNYSTQDLKKELRQRRSDQYSDQYQVIKTAELNGDYYFDCADAFWGIYSDENKLLTKDEMVKIFDSRLNNMTLAKKCTKMALVNVYSYCSDGLSIEEKIKEGHSQSYWFDTEGIGITFLLDQDAKNMLVNIESTGGHGQLHYDLDVITNANKLTWVKL